MGCDIHLHVEIRKKDPSYGINWVHCGFYGEFSDRIYAMFAVLANVRNYRNLPSLPDRGIPDDLSWYTFDELFKMSKDELKDNDGEYYYLTETAEKWAKEGYSFVHEVNGIKYYSDPDAHSYNWCTTEEMKNSFNTIFKDENGNYIGDYIEWLGLVSYMEGLESSGEYECRAVFWFDN